MREKSTLLKGRTWFFRGLDCRVWLSLEWYLLWKAKSSAGFFVRFNGVDDSGILFHCCIPYLFNLFVGLDFQWMRRFLPTEKSTYDKKPTELPVVREISFSIHDGAASWRLWMDPDEWNWDDPGWRRGSWNYVDLLLGKMSYSETDVGPVDTVLSMPEGNYQVTGRRYIAEWSRPRWPWREKQVSVVLDFEPPLPIPGKGTMSYNCGDTATCSVSRRLEYSVPHVLSEVRMETINRRMEYGGPQWKPSDGWPVSAPGENEETA